MFGAIELLRMMNTLNLKLGVIKIVLIKHYIGAWTV